MSALVVHCKREPYDVYIGRGRDPKTNEFPKTSWGNPFSHKEASAAKFKVATVEEAVQRYREWILAQPRLLDLARRELRGKVLGCWCKVKGHEPCHGDVLAEIANAESA